MKSVNIFSHTNYAFGGIFLRNFIKKFVGQQKGRAFDSLARPARQLFKTSLHLFFASLSQKDAYEGNVARHGLAKQLDAVKTEALLRLSCLAVLQLTEVYHTAILAGYNDFSLVQKAHMSLLSGVFEKPHSMTKTRHNLSGFLS